MSHKNSHSESQWFQNGSYSTVIDRSEFQLQEEKGEEQMNRLITRIQTLFEFFDVWEVGLVFREQEEEEYQISVAEAYFERMSQQKNDQLEVLISKEKAVEQLEQEIQALKSQVFLSQVELQDYLTEEFRLKQQQLTENNNCEKYDNNYKNNSRHSKNQIIKDNQLTTSVSSQHNTRQLREQEMGLHDEEDKMEEIMSNLNQRETSWREQQEIIEKKQQLCEYENTLQIDQENLILNLEQQEDMLKGIISQVECAQNSQTSKEYKKKLDSRETAALDQEKQINLKEELLLKAIMQLKQQHFIKQQMNNNNLQNMSPLNQTSSTANTTRSTNSIPSYHNQTQDRLNIQALPLPIPIPHCISNSNSTNCSTSRTGRRCSNPYTFINNRPNNQSTDLPHRPQILSNKRNPLLPPTNFNKNITTQKGNQQVENINLIQSHQAQLKKQCHLHYLQNKPQQLQQSGSQLFHSHLSISLKQSPQSELKAELSSRKNQLSARKDDLSDFLSPSNQGVGLEKKLFPQPELDQIQIDFSAAPLEAQTTMKEKIMQQLKINQISQQQDEKEPLRRQRMSVPNILTHKQENSQKNVNSQSSQIVGKMFEVLLDKSLSPTQNERQVNNCSIIDKENSYLQKKVKQSSEAKKPIFIKQSSSSTKLNFNFINKSECLEGEKNNQQQTQTSYNFINFSNQEAYQKIYNQEYSINKPPNRQSNSSQKGKGIGIKSLQLTPSRTFSFSGLAMGQDQRISSSQSSHKASINIDNNNKNCNTNSNWSGRKILNYKDEE